MRTILLLVGLLALLSPRWSAAQCAGGRCYRNPQAISGDTKGDASLRRQDASLETRWRGSPPARRRVFSRWRRWRR